MTPTLDARPLDVLQFVYGGAGGQAAVARSLSAALHRAGLTTGVVLHARTADLLTDPALWPDVATHDVIPRAGRFDLGVSRSLERIVRHRAPRALITHIPYAVGALRRMGRDGTVTATTFTEHHSLALRRRRDDLRSWRMLGAVSATILANDAYLAAYPLKLRAQRSGTVIRLVANGVDVALFRPRSASEEEAAEARRRAGGLRIGMAAVMGPGKDHPTLIRAVARVRETHPDAHLVLMGDGPTRPGLERLAEAAGLADDGRGSGVTFTGMLSAEQLADELRTLDLAVQSSAGETQSIAVLQAQATGLPVIGTRVSGVAEAIRDGVDGLLIPLGDVEAMADAIRTLADDAARAAAFGVAARSTVEQRSSLERMGQGYLALLDELDPSGPWREAHSRLG